jgi:hypothetical protein
MKLCTCKQCGHVFAVTKVKPFCSGVCRRNNQELRTPSPAILVGANTNDINYQSSR